jgi:hypothetical protein
MPDSPLHPVQPKPEPRAAAGAPGATGVQAGSGAPRRTPRPALPVGTLLYLSATLLSTLWAMVVLFVVYPRQPIDAGYTDDDAPVVSPEGNVVTVKQWRVEEAIKSGGYLAPSDEQVRLFEEQRQKTTRDVKRDKLFWFLAAAAFPGVGLVLLRGWFLWWRRA